MSHKMIEQALGRLVGTDRQGNAIGLTLAEVATLDLIRQSWRRLVEFREARRLIRCQLAVERASAGLVEA